MAMLELQPSSTALWHKLVSDAESEINIRLEEELESYLVFLLMRFSQKPEILSNILALEYINSQQACGTYRHGLLRDVGDQCLLFSGLFPKLAERRQVQISYYIDLGKVAYLDLSDSLRHSLSTMYAQLSESFIQLMDVLQVIRTMGNNHPMTNPLQAFELWSDQNSQHAYKNLVESTHAIPSSIINKNRH